jgi:hypothetical protein
MQWLSGGVWRSGGVGRVVLGFPMTPLQLGAPQRQMVSVEGGSCACA